MQDSKHNGGQRSTFVIAAGGTGGHFYPALSVARACAARGHKIYFIIGGQHAAEHQKLALDDGFEAVINDTPRLPRNPWQAVEFPWFFTAAWLQARRKLKSVKPAAVLGMGSFAAAPVCAAAISLRIPLFLHEGNAVLGTANRVFARWAERVAISLPLKSRLAKQIPVVETGLPLRTDIINAAKQPLPKTAARQKYVLAPDKPVLLIFGGSQGAAYLNELMLDAITQLTDAKDWLQVIHLTGNDADQATIKKVYEGHQFSAVIQGREENMQDCYAAADLVLCRAGAATIAELALFGLPAILVPLPSAAKKHQDANAATLAARQAAFVLDQQPGAASYFVTLIKAWQQNDAPWQKRGRNIRKFAHPNAAEQIADLLAQVA